MGKTKMLGRTAFLLILFGVPLQKNYEKDLLK